MARSTSYWSTGHLELSFSYLFRELAAGFQTSTIPAQNDKKDEKGYRDASNPSDDASDDLLLCGT